MHFAVLRAVWEPNSAFCYIRGCLGGYLALNSAFFYIKGCLGAKFNIFAVLRVVWEPFKGFFGVVPP